MSSTINTSATAFDCLILTVLGLEGGKSDIRKWRVQHRPLLLIGYSYCSDIFGTQPSVQQYTALDDAGGA